MTKEFQFFRSPAYGWVIVVLAAIAMVATMPGRTFGLGMITERLLDDSTLQLDRKMFGYINLWATLAGALFCFPAGWMLDRFGLRWTSVLVIGLLGFVVIAMTGAVGASQFAILIMLTRGLGQSALSVVSISMTGKWFRTRLPLATAVYSMLVSIGFASAFQWGRGMSDLNWRLQWNGIGIALLCLVPIFALLVRSPSDERLPFPSNEESGESPEERISEESEFTLGDALSTPAFWMFGIATSFYGLVASGTSLFNQSLLKEQGFDKNAFYDLGMMTTGVGLASNLLTGWIATRVRITTIGAAAMFLLGSALLGFRFVETYSSLVVYAAAMGCAGGIVTVVFFTVWAKLYGRAHLGRIQSLAQMMTVFASALGPVVLAEVESRYHSYLPAIVCLGLLALLLAIGMMVVPMPKKIEKIEPLFATIQAPGS